MAALSNVDIRETPVLSRSVGTPEVSYVTKIDVIGRVEFQEDTRRAAAARHIDDLVSSDCASLRQIHCVVWDLIGYVIRARGYLPPGRIE